MKILIIRKVSEKHVILKRNLWYIKYHSIYWFLLYSQYSGKVKVMRSYKIVIFSESLCDPAHHEDSRSCSPMTWR